MSTIYVRFLDNHQEESATALAELENIDTQADKVGIAFVKINDLELVSEFGLGNLPCLVYYRHTTPIVYDGKTSIISSGISVFNGMLPFSGFRKYHILRRFRKLSVQTIFKAIFSKVLCCFPSVARVVKKPRKM